MQNQFKISETARFFGMTPRMLRHYEKLGILKPAYTDKNSRYRYYDADSCDRLAAIADFKYIGMSMEETGNYLRGQLSAEEIAARFDEKIALLKRKKAMILQHGKQEHGAYEVTQGIFPACRCLTREIEGETLGIFTQKIYDFIGDAIRAGAVLSPATGSFFEVLTGCFRLTKIRSRYCIPLAKGITVPGAEPRKARTVIRTTHFGKLGNAGNAFVCLKKYALKHKLEIIGEPLFRILEGAYGGKNSYCVREALYEVKGKKSS